MKICVKTERAKYDRKNLATAHEVLSNPEKFPHLVDWAQRVVDRLCGTGQAKSVIGWRKDDR